ncbi:MAG: DUF4071 domain-containing protein [Flammeovirgaceae bacterium]|nr:DUF4071 domain-containing protein [Flammeovirgaceae bacterium]
MSGSLQHLEELIGQGRYMEARLLCEKEKEPTLRYSQLYALALSKSGSPKQALNYLEPVFTKHPDDSETSGILGGIFKELFRVTQDSSYAVRSRDTYLQNFSATKNYYTGINAATMSAIAGQMRKGREIAVEVIQVIDKDTTEFWELCTLAEAHLLLKDKQESVDLYFKARAIAHSDWGKISSVYNQLWLIDHYTSVPKEVMKAFSPPAVAAFVGHMIDSPTREKPRFPAGIETQVRNALKSAVQTNNIRIGYCALACGGDILFAEAIEEVGGEVNISLPFKPADFIELSVRFAGENWVDRFNRLIEKYPVRLITDEGYGGYNDLFSFESKIILGRQYYAVKHSMLNQS